MPIGELKNQLYAVGVSLLGRRSHCEELIQSGAEPELDPAPRLRAIWRKNHVIGGGVQSIADGALQTLYLSGLKRLHPREPVDDGTVFRTASIAKLAAALLVMRLHQEGKLSVDEDVSDFLGYRLRNPLYPDQPILLKHLLSHSSGILDTPAYERTYRAPAPLDDLLLRDPAVFAPYAPGRRYAYSNLGAGTVATMLELRFSRSFERLMQELVFAPLGVDGTFDLSAVSPERMTDIYRVFPGFGKPRFDARARIAKAKPVAEPDPQWHYVCGIGNLYITPRELAKLGLPLIDASADGDAPYLTRATLRLMKTPVVRYPGDDLSIWHCLGLMQYTPKDQSPIYGHQGFAYGCVNGLFIRDENRAGFASLNSGSSEHRADRLGTVNRDLAELFL